VFLFYFYFLEKHQKKKKIILNTPETPPGVTGNIIIFIYIILVLEL
jgi:hypothetical protein